ncbi:MAG TPA: oligoendopeptidase F [Planctomycetaceae bacterium]|nr:oligoendopeptidase F [Planctomycetaceae bacterium]
MSYPIKWSLSSLGPEPGTERFTRWLTKIRVEYQAFAKNAENFSTVVTAKSLAELVNEYSLCRREYWQVNSLVECYASSDTAREEYRQAEAAVAALFPHVEKADHLLDRIIKNIEEGTWSTLVDNKQLADVKGFVIRRRNEASTRLPDHLADFASELSVDGLNAWSRLYDSLSAAVRIPVMEHGEVKMKSPGQVAFDSPDRTDRENKFFSSQKAWRDVDETAAATLNHIVGSRLTVNKYAERESHLTIPMQQNRVTQKTIDAMWSAITEAKPLVQKYLRTKQKLLGLPELNWYDLEAPLNLGSTKVGYQESCDIILDAFSKFHPPLRDFTELAFNNGWIEAEDRSGKRQGGFCIDFPTSEETRIFMTFRDTEESLSTLAHELGHAYHAWVLRKHPVVMQVYPMTLAETASTFAETVVASQRFDALTTTAAKVKALEYQLYDSVAFLMNIHARYIFENEMHRKRAEGELSAGELHDLMVKSQKTAYLDSLVEWNPTFWISKLHFYISYEPFYNFPYTVGYLLSQRLYEEARLDPAGFPARYDQFLISTGGPSALTAAKEAFGYDLESEAFWSEAIQPIRNRVEMFCQLAEEL